MANVRYTSCHSTRSHLFYIHQWLVDALVIYCMIHKMKKKIANCVFIVRMFVRFQLWVNRIEFEFGSLTIKLYWTSYSSFSLSSSVSFNIRLIIQWFHLLCGVFCLIFLPLFYFVHIENTFAAGNFIDTCMWICCLSMCSSLFLPPFLLTCVRPFQWHIIVHRFHLCSYLSISVSIERGAAAIIDINHCHGYSPVLQQNAFINGMLQRGWVTQRCKQLHL